MEELSTYRHRILIRINLSNENKIYFVLCINPENEKSTEKTKFQFDISRIME